MPKAEDLQEHATGSEVCELTARRESAGHENPRASVGDGGDRQGLPRIRAEVVVWGRVEGVKTRSGLCAIGKGMQCRG